MAALLVPLFAFPSAGLAQAAAAKALDPIAGIVDAFQTHDVVALGEGDHGNEQGAAFRAKLYRDPRFQAVVNDIVVESGNGLLPEGTKATSARSIQIASTNPAAPPAIESNRLSTSNCDTILPRLAPSASRTAISF